MKEITITQIGFSPDKMERVVLTYSVKEAHGLHAKADTVELPRVTYTKKYDKEKGTVEEVPVNALTGGHFTHHFQTRAQRAVIDHFFPAEYENLKALLAGVTAIRHAATKLEEEPLLKVKKHVAELQKVLKAMPKMTDDLQAAWQVLVLTRQRIHAFGRGTEDE